MGLRAVQLTDADAGAVDAYLRARVQWHRRTESGLRHSASLFEKVVAREPGYARAWSGLADAYAVLAFYDHVPPHVAFPRADSAARRAILLDSTLAAPYATLAYVDTYYHWNWTAAEHGFLRSLELEPTYSTAHQWYGNLLVARGRFEEAERAMRRAAELDPLSMIAHATVGWVFVMANQNDRAIRQFRSVLQLDPNFQQASYWLGVSLEQNGQASEAIPVLQRFLRGSSDSIIGRAALGRAHAMAGQTGAARAVLDELLAEESSGHYVSSYGLAKVYQAMGDVSSALLRLERAYGERAHSMAFLTVDPQLRALASEPRFQALVKRVNQPHHEP